MPREIKRDENKRAAAAEQKRLRRAQMTEEELKKVRAAEAERVRQKRARKSEEERLQMKARNAALKRERCAQMTEEELEERRAREAARKRQKRSSVKSEEELQRLKASRAELHRQKHAKMTEDEREKTKAKLSENARRRKAEMTEEEKKNYRAQQAEQQRRKMAGMTEEERKRYKVKNAERLKRKINGTTVERIQAFMSQAGELAHRHRAKYEAHGTFIKNSLGEILNLYTEAGKLRQTLRQTVADAVKNAVSLHQIEKQTRAEGFRSLTFVEISARPLNSKRTIKQELSTDDTEADPLIDQPVIPNQESPSNEIPNQNFTNEQADETFKVCSYEALGASAENSTGVNTSKKFECSICSKKFETSLGLTIHQKEHRNVAGEFKCSLCPQMFNDCNLMTTHYLEPHSLEFDANATPSEPEYEEADEVLERHRHEFEFLYMRKCLICFQTFDRPVLASYSHHVISDHSDNKEMLKTFTYICARCDKPHTVLRSLESHWKTFCYEKWKTEDWNNGGIVCEKCGMRFSNFKSLTSHTSMSHEEIKKVVCEQCGKEFNDEKLLKMHVKAMHETKTAECMFTCEHCGKTFKSKSNLIKHTKNVHLGEKRFACKLCDKRFQSNWKVDQHMITHTGEKIFQPSVPSKYECDICGKSFKSSSRLTDHKYTHDSVRRFACSLCGKTFKQRTTFNQHRRKAHANEYAQIVEIISEKEAPADLFANLLPICNDVSSTLYNLPDRRNSNSVSNMSLEPQYSPGREDYSPEMEYDDRIMELETPLPQFKTGELENANLQNNISLPATNHPEQSVSLKHSVLETNTKDFQPSLPHSSMFVDFSRANVPLVVSTLTDVRSDAEVGKEKSKNISKQKGKQQNLKVFIEDSEEDSFVADFDANDFVKIKIEPREDKDKESPRVKVKSEASILAEEISSPYPNVKLTKLLEYYCVRCDKTMSMSSQREIRKHRRSHTKKKLQKKANIINSGDGEKKKMRCFDCLYCETKGLTGRTIIVHCAEEHPGQKPIKCPICPRMFNSKDTYYNHKTKRHNLPKPKPPSCTRGPNAKRDVLCEVCGKGFFTKAVMWSHRSTMHRVDSSVETVECDICHKMIRGKHNLRLHKNRHLAIKPHLCEECGMSFCTPGELKEHVRVIHRGEQKRPRATYNRARPFPCLLCPRTYVTEIGLQKHMNFHDPERKYACDQCGFRYKTYQTLSVHINIKHNNIKPVRKSIKKPPADMLTISA